MVWAVWYTRVYVLQLRLIQSSWCGGCKSLKNVSVLFINHFSIICTYVFCLSFSQIHSHRRVWIFANWYNPTHVPCMHRAPNRRFKLWANKNILQTMPKIGWLPFFSADTTKFSIVLRSLRAYKILSHKYYKRLFIYYYYFWRKCLVVNLLWSRQTQ